MKYKTVSKNNPANKEVAPKYYAAPVYTGEISLKRISAELAALSSLSSGDVNNVLANFVEALPKYLKDGYKLRLGDFGDFGIFKVSFSSEGQAEPKKVMPAHIKNRKVLYTAGKDIKNSLNEIRFERRNGQTDKRMNG